MIKQPLNDTHRAPEDKAVSGETIGELINLAGRQRMLSQRIVLHVLLAAQGHEAATGIAKQCLSIFAATHEDLVSGNDRLPGVFCEALRQLYFGSQRADERIRRFIGDAERAISLISTHSADAPAAADALVNQASPLLELLQSITLGYQNEMRNVERAATQRDAQLAEQLGRISMQANIVAINARISAGRAGPYGREFAVVTSLLADIVKEMERMIHGVVRAREPAPRLR
ncbi:chemotaxis protein [Trinickia dabaoshanensis]|uniref:Chemotaxis protein n=1 Tax=Trinickia dabaoshanensis TaxID=564714 RepID=A0A2N7VIT8_9BURK|nr:type IV pili methyl-accepting chemotaxis transducer N-terminal domain-containing protein [Trinickia dabaoshanensis]PMS17072.1 chemotaxis protein [Trinickia dabaoshanensis]